MSTPERNQQREVRNLFEKTLNYQFRKPSLLTEALTHASIQGKNCNNERLEFLGDRVLGLVIAKTLYQLYPKAPEGKLAIQQAYLVSREVLGKIADKLNLGEALHMGHADRMTGILKKKSIIANACEAVIAALFLDGGLEVAERFILEHWSTELEASETLERPAKSFLQEWAQGRGKPAPVYVLMHQTGPAHDPVFEIGVHVKGLEMVMGKGSSKQEAEQNAAKALLNHIRSQNV